MKRLHILFLLAMTCITAMAQEPTTSWPYLYSDFCEGTIYMRQGQIIQQRLNVHLGHSKMHFLDGETIRQLSLNDVVTIQIGNDKFIPRDGEMLKVEQSTPKGFVASKTLGDFTTLNETGGAYGTSSTTQATMKVSSLETLPMEGENHMLKLQGKNNGQALPTRTKYYIVTSSFTCPATKNDLTDVFEGKEDQWKAFLKAHKIKWNKPESLAQIFEFID